MLVGHQSSLGKCLFKSLAQFLIGLFVFFLSDYKSYLYTVDTRNYVEFIDPFGENCHVNDTVSSSLYGTSVYLILQLGQCQVENLL